MVSTESLMNWNLKAQWNIGIVRISLIEKLRYITFIQRLVKKGKVYFLQAINALVNM